MPDCHIIAKKNSINLFYIKEQLKMLNNNGYIRSVIIEELC